MLEKYNNKRNFKNTSEPLGKVNKNSKKRFVVQYHKARANHYDFRLEHNGVLLSWAVPKGLSFNPQHKRLAVMVEDHPVSYINFEGVIPKGNYGAGSVSIFDFGTYLPLTDFKTGLKKGILKFSLSGNILNGAWNLVRTNNNNWLIIKEKDNFASIKKEAPQTQKNPFNSLSVQLATLADSIPKGKNWLFEIKYDGYRIVSFIEENKAQLLSRNMQDYTKKFKNICSSLIKVSSRTPMVFDGEVVCFDANGKSDFGLLQQNLRNGKDKFFYVIFDILSYNGKDLRPLPLLKRKEFLQKVLTNCPSNIVYSSYVIGKGKQSFNVAKKLNLEGIVAKKTDSIYLGKRTEDWLKIKCQKRQEFVIVGYLTSSKNKLLSAVLVAYYKNKRIVYAGKVGTGFSDKLKQDLHKLFKNLICDKYEIDNLPSSKNVIWLKPKLVAEIKFAEFTKENILRQPSFVGLRQDKNAADVVLE